MLKELGNFLPREAGANAYSQKQVAGAACCDSGNTTCVAGLSCITGCTIYDIKRTSARRKLAMDRPKNNHMIHFLLVGAPVMV